MVKIKALTMTYRDYDLDILAKAYFTNDELEIIQGIYDSIVALETCNRVEFYLDGDEDEDELVNIIRNRAGVEPRILYDLDVVKHLLLVTTGLDSMFLGEREILSQVKRAFAMGKPSVRLRILFESAIRFGEAFRRKYDLSEISFIKFLANYVMSNLDGGRDGKVLVVGGGEVARGVVRELLRNGYDKVTIINRSLDRVRQEFGNTVRALSLSSLDNELRSNRYDVMVVAISTKSPLIIIDDHNYNMPNLIIDVSEPSAVEVRNNLTRLIRLEDLREPYLKYINGKSSILNRLDDINQEAERIMRLILRSDAEDLVRDVMRFIEDIRKEEVREAVNALMSGHDPRDVIEAMSRSLIKKLMHNYLENMRKLVETGNELEAEKLRNYLIKMP